MALFFVTMGALMNPVAILEHPQILAILVVLIVAGKFVIWTLVVWLLGNSLWTAALVGVGLTQIGEFSFILVQVARQAGHVNEAVYQATLAASLLTILGNAALMRAAPRLLARLGLGQPKVTEQVKRTARDPNHVVLCGFGRVGSAVGEALDTFEVSYVAIESDPEIVKGLRARGVDCVFGDAADSATLEAAGAREAAQVIVAVPDIEVAHAAVRNARAANQGSRILARAHHPAARSDSFTLAPRR